jgi:hypothetical protein
MICQWWWGEQHLWSREHLCLGASSLGLRAYSIARDDEIPHLLKVRWAEPKPVSGTPGSLSVLRHPSP